MKRLSTLFMFLCLAATATGQIVTLHLKDSKAARRYKKNVVKINGDWAIVGEPFRGPIVKGQNITITEEMTLFVVDPARPDRVPYRLVGGEKVPAKGKRTTLTVSRDYVTKVTIYSNRETLAGLANEYRIKLEGAERLARRTFEGQALQPRVVCDSAAHGECLRTAPRLASVDGLPGRRQEAREEDQIRVTASEGRCATGTGARRASNQ